MTEKKLKQLEDMAFGMNDRAWDNEKVIGRLWDIVWGNEEDELEIVELMICADVQGWFK